MVLPLNHENEEQRLLTLKRYTLGDLSADDHFDRITQLAAAYCDTPIALMTLVDDTHVWVKSSVGQSAQRMLREHSFCGIAIEKTSAVRSTRCPPGRLAKTITPGEFASAHRVLCRSASDRRQWQHHRHALRHGYPAPSALQRTKRATSATGQ